MSTNLPPGMMSGAAPGLGPLHERAYCLLAERGSAAEDELLRHLFGAVVPPALRERLLGPLLADARFTRRPEGVWTLAQPRKDPADGAGLEAEQRGASLSATDSFTALAVAANGPRPGRHRLVALAAAEVAGETTVAWFTTSVRPERGRVPRYAAEHARLAPDLLDDAPSFGAIFDSLLAFLGTRPVFCQEAYLVRGFLRGEAVRINRVWPDEPPFLDLNALAEQLLPLQRKPTLAHIAQRLGIGFQRLGEPGEDARVVARCTSRLLSLAHRAGLDLRDGGWAVEPDVTVAPLAESAVVRGLPDSAGVYVLRGREADPLYVGKARRLRQRLGAYAHRPLGVTRRLERLAPTVRSIETYGCENDLEALVRETCEIQRLQPRFNTQRHLHGPSLWLRLPPLSTSQRTDESQEKRKKRRPLAPPRLTVCARVADDGASYLGPFRSEAAARDAHSLVRAVFGLDQARLKVERAAYLDLLHAAWRFLAGDTGYGLERTRAELSAAGLAGDQAAARRWRRLLTRALAYDPALILLPADPCTATYAVVRLDGDEAVEGFVLACGVLVAYAAAAASGSLAAWATALAFERRQRTQPADVPVVLRWLAAQRPATTRTVLLPADADRAAQAIAAATDDLLAARRSERFRAARNT